jgi:hypothetical protein
MPSVRWITRSRAKLTMMRGENCIEVGVSVISKAKTIETTVIIEPAIPARMTWATCGSAREGNKTFGTQVLRTGTASSSAERSAPADPSVSAMMSGRTRKLPRRLYITWWNERTRRSFSMSAEA